MILSIYRKLVFVTFFYLTLISNKMMNDIFLHSIKQINVKKTLTDVIDYTKIYKYFRLKNKKKIKK